MKFLKLLVIATLFTSCNQIAKYSGKTYLEVEDHTLRIKKFNWGYGTIEINKFSGDFDMLDKMVYAELKGKKGDYSVSITSVKKDSYGNDQETTETVGTINADELSRYKDWEYWHKDDGIQSLLYKKYVQPPPAVPINNTQSYQSTTPIEGVLMEPKDRVDSVGGDGREYRWNIKAQKYELLKAATPKPSFTLTFEELYPDSEDRDNMGSQGFTKEQNGTIKAANFYNGSLEVVTNGGEYMALRIEPVNLSTYKKSDLRYYLKSGNKIKFLCAPMGARELIIVAARFTEP